MKIGINCGHTKIGAGCGAKGYISESVETRNVGYELMKLLKAAGHTVVDCTVDSAATQAAYLSNAVKIANAQTLDYFVSIHFNAGGGKGAEVFTYKGEKMPEAVKICENLKGLGFTNRGIKDGSGLYVINSTKAKAMLIEVCFVDTKSDVDLYYMLGVDEIAKAIFNGITGQEVEEMTERQVQAIAKEIATEVFNLKSEKVYNSLDEVPEKLKPTIKKLIDNGSLQGENNGKLNLSYTMARILAILDRNGIFS